MPLDVDELERLAKAATPGHWACIADKLGVWVQCIGGEHVAEFQSSRDAALSVSARNALPELIERVRKAESERDFAQGRATAHAVTIGRLEARVAELEAACKNWREMGERADLKVARLEMALREIQAAAGAGMRKMLHEQAADSNCIWVEIETALVRAVERSESVLGPLPKEGE